MMIAIKKKKKKTIKQIRKTFIDQCDQNNAPSWRDWHPPGGEGHLWPPDGDVQLSTESKGWCRDEHRWRFHSQLSRVWSSLTVCVMCCKLSDHLAATVTESPTGCHGATWGSSRAVSLPVGERRQIHPVSQKPVRTFREAVAHDDDQ